MIDIMFHDDWEIYGDGTGDPEKLMFDPARRILDICDTYGAKYTFYAEIGQQLHMLNAPSGKWQKYADTWESILKDAIQRGHDVQMHFHPQWIGAELHNVKWKLDFSKWSAGKVAYELLDEWIGKGKRYIENFLQTVDKGYRVVSFRAGGWMCQPSAALYKALKSNGILTDVSVMKGRYARFADSSYVDFRNAVSRYNPWEVNPTNFALEKKGSGVWELPVFTEVSSLPQSVYLLKKSFRPIYYYNIYKKRKIQKGGGDYSPKKVERGKYKEYYGSFGYMHYKQLLSFVINLNKYSSRNGQPYHLIFLTHSKSFLDFNNFDKLLKSLSEEDKINFVTTHEYIENYLPV